MTDAVPLDVEQAARQFDAHRRFQPALADTGYRGGAGTGAAGAGFADTAFPDPQAGALGERLGVSRQTINSIETGKYDPSLPLAFQIARLFGEPIEAIFLFEP